MLKYDIHNEQLKLSVLLQLLKLSKSSVMQFTYCMVIFVIFTISMYLIDSVIMV